MTLKTIDSSELIRSANRVLDIEIASLQALHQRIDESFCRACDLLFKCTGKVVVTGMGKSGHIGHKIAATLASTGTPSFFMHPGEANHGDLGMLAHDDVLLAISNSGETHEVLNILPVVKRMNVPVIAMASSPDSTLAQQADVYLDISVKQEACSLGLAPTSSTTVTLVLGDALAVSLLEARGFTSEDFALSHPGGSLGRRLLLRVDDIMLRNQDIPLISESANISEALLEVSKKGLGLTGVIDAEHTLKGIFTDGDLRRILDQKIDLHATPISQVMTKNGVTVSPQEMAVDALNTMEEKRISALMVVDADRKPVGAFNMHILLKAGVV